MFCPGCEEEKAQKDFMLDHEKCYRCTYREKLKKCGGSRRRCKICYERVPGQRVQYCSKKCAEKGWELQKNQRYSDRKLNELKEHQRENPHLYAKKCESSLSSAGVRP